MTKNAARSIEDFPRRFNAAEDLIKPIIESGLGEKTAIIDYRGELSYLELSMRVDRMAAAWESLGISTGDRVLICLTDSRDFPTVFLGAIKAGVTPVPLNTLLTTDDFRWILEDSGARAVFVSGDLTAQWAEIADANSDIVFVSSDGGSWEDLETILTSVAPRAEPEDTKPDDIAFWLYSSGSTGRPKGAMHRHASLRLTANLYGAGVLNIHESDVVFSVAKQFFAYGLGNSLTFPFSVGATVVLVQGRVTPDLVNQVFARHQITILAGVPTFFASWLDCEKCPTKDQAPHLRIAISAGEALPQYLSRVFKKRFDADIHDGLGSTEMLHIFLSQQPGDVRFGSTGKPVDGYKLRLVDDAGAEVRTGEIGNLHVAGPTSARAYWNNPDKSASTFQQEWTVTGDKLRCDADGWYYFAGRDDDMLKVSGIYVSPNEVEEALVSHDYVIEAAVVGYSDEADLIKPRAFVVLKSGVDPTDSMVSDLKSHVKSLLAPYKYPRKIHFVDELPKTATGKIQRFKLRELP